MSTLCVDSSGRFASNFSLVSNWSFATAGRLGAKGVGSTVRVSGKSSASECRRLGVVRANTNDHGRHRRAQISLCDYRTDALFLETSETSTARAVRDASPARTYARQPINIPD